ncbi:MAG TPA: hypothetical protein PK723_04130 [Candidatus Pacearchaeota archaeon]|jgi:hypothetical protein|nr:hypothetical protein [Candidatus Pacearchaeota archaeon]
MKKITCFVIILLLVTACATTKKYYVHGEYDKAIAHAVKKIKANPNNKKEIIYLEKSFNIANQYDLERINFLRAEGRPENWGEILDLYINLQNRQSLIQSILPLKLDGRNLNFPYVNYDEDIIYAKKKAAEYWYAKGKQLLVSGDRFQTRQAYEYFMNIKNYFPSYQDVDQLITQASHQGVTRVGLVFENNTIYNLPSNYVNELFNLDFQRLNNKWIQYYPQINQNEKYHYIIKLNLKAILLSPAEVSHNETIKTKKIQDGTEVLLDSNNDVVKDSLGNPVRVPRIVEVSCKLTETIQSRSARLTGDITYFEVETQNVITTKPLTTDYFFKYITYTANGDLRALDKYILLKLGEVLVPFPNDIEMIIGATDLFKNAFFNLLLANRWNIK